MFLEKCSFEFENRKEFLKSLTNIARFLTQHDLKIDRFTI